MHEERYEISDTAAKKINQAIQMNKNIIAVGTTVVRTLESAYIKQKIQEGIGKTRLFIYPGYKFKVVTKMITNFHLPKSTLIVMISAFASQAIIKKAYQTAIKLKYRFYSFGDAMLITN